MLIWLILLWLFDRNLAMASSGVMVSPAYSEVLIGEKDLSVTNEVVFVNNLPFTVELKMSVIDFGSMDESGGVAFLAMNDNDDRKYGLASWLKLSTDKIMIDSGKHESVQVMVKNRESLSPGGHYGAVVGTIVSAENEANLSISQSLASLIYVNKYDGAVKELKFNSLRGDDLWWKLKKVIVRLKNTGNVHIFPRGTVRVMKQDREIARGVINRESGLIMPETYRKYDVELRKNQLWVWPGRYFIRVDYRFEGDAEYSYAKKSFIYFGWEGFVCVAILVAGWWCWRMVRKK